MNMKKEFLLGLVLSVPFGILISQRNNPNSISKEMSLEIIKGMKIKKIGIIELDKPIYLYKTFKIFLDEFMI